MQQLDLKAKRLQLSLLVALTSIWYGSLTYNQLHHQSRTGTGLGTSAWVMCASLTYLPLVGLLPGEQI